MFRTREVPLEGGLRWLVGAIGAVAILAGLAVAAFELARVARGELLQLPLALVALAAVLGGLSLLRSALRGRLAVRAYGARR